VRQLETGWGCAWVTRPSQGGTGRCDLRNLWTIVVEPRSGRETQRRSTCVPDWDTLCRSTPPVWSGRSGTVDCEGTARPFQPHCPRFRDQPRARDRPRLRVVQGIPLDLEKLAPLADEAHRQAAIRSVNPSLVNGCSPRLSGFPALAGLTFSQPSRMPHRLPERRAHARNVGRLVQGCLPGRPLLSIPVVIVRGLATSLRVPATALPKIGRGVRLCGLTSARERLLHTLPKGCVKNSCKVGKRAKQPRK